MDKIIVEITGDFITVDSLLKYAGIVGSGGQAGKAIMSGLVKINGRTVKEKRKKVYVGDEVSFENNILSVRVKEI